LNFWWEAIGGEDFQRCYSKYPSEPTEPGKNEWKGHTGASFYCYHSTIKENDEGRRRKRRRMRR